MTVFLQTRNKWCCFKGSNAIEKGKSKAHYLLSLGIPSILWHKGWILIAKYN